MLNIRIHILLIQIHFKLTQALSESNSRAWAKRRAYMRHRCIIPIIIHVQVIEVVMVGHSPFDWFNASKVRRQQPLKTRFPFYGDNRRWPQSHHILIVRVSTVYFELIITLTLCWSCNEIGLPIRVLLSVSDCRFICESRKNNWTDFECIQLSVAHQNVSLFSCDRRISIDPIFCECRIWNGLIELSDNVVDSSNYYRFREITAYYVWMPHMWSAGHHTKYNTTIAGLTTNVSCSLYGCLSLILFNSYIGAKENFSDLQHIQQLIIMSDCLSCTL